LPVCFRKPINGKQKVKDLASMQMAGVLIPIIHYYFILKFDVMARYSKGSQKKVKRAMHEMKRGELKSGRSGKTVKSRKQAIAIGLSEARKQGSKVPKKKAAPKKRAAPKKKAAKKKSAVRKKSSPRKKAAAKRSTPRKKKKA
jgi:hypothetical protein